MTQCQKQLRPMRKARKFKGKQAPEKVVTPRLQKIIRHGQPGTLDEAPHGTACFVHLAKEHYVYVQVSKTMIPRWELMGMYPDNYSKKKLKEEVDAFKKLKF